MQQLSLAETFIISIWLEALVYGFFLCLFCASLYVNFTLRRWQDGHSRAMFIMGVVFWLIATIHLSMNCYRMIQGYVVHEADSGGAAAYIGALAPWHHVFKDTLYATQEILGDAVAIYRCYVIWNREWRIVVLPLVLFVVSLISGYTVCGLYPSQIAGSTVFDPRLTHWISAFYAVAVVQSIITTGLMAYKIWKTDRRTASYRANTGSRSNLLPVVRILVESASLQMFVEIILLGLYAADINAQYILLETVTPIVGITFTAITIRLTLRMSGALDTSKASMNYSTHGTGPAPQIATIGSMPMRPIAINITQDVHLKEDPDRHVYTTQSHGSERTPRSSYHHRKAASVPISMVDADVLGAGEERFGGLGLGNRDMRLDMNVVDEKGYAEEEDSARSSSFAEKFDSPVDEDDLDGVIDLKRDGHPRLPYRHAV